ncbi:unnamed protein product [Euphydryas editha]|uniref:Uncharacterized protein n=1 Tax=Euphydryas editha TaxID=104508 RepID=A0AAU9TGF3_EUPED|nr:unnamed protein product [Euphydryas editha]
MNRLHLRGFHRIKMSRKQYFGGSNNLRGLEEAINNLAEDSDDDLEYDLAIIPPSQALLRMKKRVTLI